MQPEIMPMNRYKALEDYIRDVLLPEVTARIQSWEQAEQFHNKLAVPSRLSLVTLTGWLLSYPINYVLPGHGRRYSSGTCGSAGCSPRYEGNMSQFPSLQSNILQSPDPFLSVDPDEEEDEDQDNGRNVLANQALVVTRVQLEPNERVDGLQEHCLLSFSYPAELAERLQDKTSPAPSSPLTPTVNALQISTDENGAGSSSVSSFRLPSALSSTASLHSNMSSASLSSLASATTTSNSMPRTKMDDDTTGSMLEDPQQLSPRLPSSESFDKNRPLPFSNPDICAAGRSFLTTLHARFHKQSLWKTWQVGQQTVTLPVVAM
ncbi:hypothetical protein EMPS_03854 [Entomortierella parvispora]|uniref:Uncharacterized protein n=1 Tax=Entomortierella parvispora TaxID=205924 RepID=A0A9P3H7C9_9FUNG|nr:hypothetical protein EMPS_03854 [Entomortierella parvispora]